MKPRREYYSIRRNVCMCVSESGCSGNEATLKTSGISNAVWVKRHDESTKRTFCSRVQKLQCHSRRSADCYDRYVLVLGGKKFCFGFLYPPKIWIGRFLWVKNRSDETFKSLKVIRWGEWVQSAFSLVQTDAATWTVNLIWICFMFWLLFICLF